MSGAWTFQVLRLGVTVTCDSDRMADRLRSVLPAARQTVQVRRTVRYDVTRTRGRGYLIDRDGSPFEVEFDPDGVAARLAWDIRRQALALHERGALLEAAVGTYRGERFRLSGGTQEARSSVARDLLRLGAVIEGDDVCIVDGGMVTAYPRMLRAIASRARAAAPPWSIGTAKPTCLVVLELNPGGHGRLTTLAAHQACQELVRHARGLGSPVDAVREAAAVAAGARCFRLWLSSEGELARLWPSAAGAGTVPEL